MAYLNLLASVPEQQVQALRQDSTLLLRPSLRVAVSHLIGYWVEIQPLGKLLGQAIDGGEPISKNLWHPLRSPVFHGPEMARTLYQGIDDAFRDARGPQADESDWDWYRDEINKVLRIFRHASDRGECVVSVVEPPADAERADRVRIPFEANTGPATGLDVPTQTTASPPDTPTLWSLPSVLGFIASGVILGVLGLGFWRYRRLKKHTA